MRNEVVTICCFAGVTLLVALIGHSLLVKLNDSEGRVAALEQQNDELKSSIEDMENEIKGYKLTMEEYHSETDAYASETNATIDNLKNTVEEFKIEKEANEPTLLKEEQKKTEEMPVTDTESTTESDPEPIVEAAVEEPEVTEDCGDPIGASFVGTYELTAYEWTGNPCANGNYPTVGYTVACNSLPLGTRILIEGYGEYVVEDTGGMGGGVIDIYMGDYDTCIQFGRRSANVYIIE